ncbi:hypothetical protein IFDJLNFL_0147 [Methylobacterium dankookense]|uniref:Uncharacterized protein n=1 Tax=Methylobacterium dankookense TaxID=560405 RepID=A0ABQ4RB08_9HYPH|nr:hypothetical protein IFDJLNFL_0147 [Methylobacterium dankookense]
MPARRDETPDQQRGRGGQGDGGTGGLEMRGEAATPPVQGPPAGAHEGIRDPFQIRAEEPGSGGRRQFVPVAVEPPVHRVGRVRETVEPAPCTRPFPLQPAQGPHEAGLLVREIGDEARRAGIAPQRRIEASGEGGRVQVEFVDQVGEKPVAAAQDARAGEGRRHLVDEMRDVGVVALDEMPDVHAASSQARDRRSRARVPDQGRRGAEGFPAGVLNRAGAA